MESRLVELSLSNDEAIVFFDWLARFNQARRNDSFEDQSEERVLWDLEARLETALAEPLGPDYPQRLAAARAAVRDTE